MVVLSIFVFSRNTNTPKAFIYHRSCFEYPYPMVASASTAGVAGGGDAAAARNASQINHD